MNVSPLEPFQLIYSMFEHEYLGCIFEPYVVQLNPKGELTLKTQNIWSKNAKEFASELNEVDFQIIKWVDAMQQEVVAKKFNTKKNINEVDFFLKVFDAEKGDKILRETIEGYVNNLRAQVLTALLKNKRLFIMSKDGDAVRSEVQVCTEPATILFHFIRNEDNTHYFPTIKHNGEKVEFKYKNAIIVNDEPAWLLSENKLYHFDKEVDGKKLKPFLQKNFILIPKKIEESYFQKFVLPLITMFDVHAKGFHIRTEHFDPMPILYIQELELAQNQLQLFAQEEPADKPSEHEIEASLSLMFRYGDQSFRFDSFAAQANVTMEKTEGSFLFHKIVRKLKKEREIIQYLKQLGLDFSNGKLRLPKYKAFNWLLENFEVLQSHQIEVKQANDEGKRYFIGYSSIELKLSEQTDWFDVHALVKFGDMEIPFIKLKNVILSKKREFVLPNGELAMIPANWITQYAELFTFVEKNLNEEKLILKKHHFSLVQNLEKENLADVVINRKLENLQNFEKIEDQPISPNFNGELRPYQKAGYNWMLFLQQFNLGGCLADDMGLGKTVQTLALLQYQKDKDANMPSLLIMPTSLTYNWEMEARKFTPHLKVMVYTGSHRDKNISYFIDYDLIITSYGLARIDIDELSVFRFNYVILDESQAIKNPSSIISNAVMRLNAKHRLVLTGTPIENSTLDLWSQMTFINPGLLGTINFFRNNYLAPIEKKADDEKLKKLHSLIKPFILRRHKSQVATELPPKVESIHYCEMTEAQEEAYETAKSYYRNIILNAIESDGLAHSQIVLLQGLTKLRQIANHPAMVDTNYDKDSGKLEEIISKIETATEENHKVLVFSQFVKHLNLVKQYLDQEKMTYAYLDGSTKNRQEQVEFFQKNDNVKIFLISLRAGGVGLNLTAADYVLILDPWWNPAVEAQAVDRAHRIGQEKTVFTYKMITKNTVEEKILALQQNKLKLANSLINTEESFMKSLSREDIEALLS